MVNRPIPFHEKNRLGHDGSGKQRAELQP